MPRPKTSPELSPAVQEALFGDAAVLRYLAIAEAHYKDGERSALFHALALCARFQAVIPEWAADAILDGERALGAGECEDFNALFGPVATKKGARQREELIRRNKAAVVAKLMMHRCAGGGFNADLDLGEVSTETGVPRRIVEEIYRRYGAGLKDIPRGNPDCRVIAAIDIPWPRRTGRSIL